MNTIDIYADTALPVLERAAEAVAYHWDAFLSADDLYQSAWLYRIEHAALVSSFIDKEVPDMNGLQRVIESYLTSLARKEKALQIGYHVDDEVFYTPNVIAELLPICLDLEAALSPSAPSDDSPSGRTHNPHGQSDFLTTLLDVREAWTKVAFRGSEMRLIEAHFMDDMTYDHAAASFGITVDEAKRQVAIGLRRMSEHLGGLPPRRHIRALAEFEKANE